jgi:hypothetical protein
LLRADADRTLAVAAGVVDEIGERALKLRRIDLEHRQAALDRNVERTRVVISALGDAFNQLFDRCPILVGIKLTRLQAGEVEEVVDQLREPPRFHRYHRHQLFALMAIESPGPKSPDGGRNRRQRGPQVV